MERSQESFAVDPAYLQYFGLARAPFAALADPAEQFPCEQYLLLMEHLEHAAANADSLVVVCGADGSGKSTLIRRFIGAIQDEVSCVLIDAATHQGVVPFYRSFLQQIGFNDITGSASELGNITREFLVCRGIAGDHVLVVIDNTHLVDPRILEQLRRLCDIKIKDRRAISVVLFGNADIVRVVDAPAMRQAPYASHVVFNIRSFGEQDTAGYIRHRLELAGAADGQIFPDAVCALIHRYTGGNPRRINKLAADVLEEAHRVNSRTVSTDVVRGIINQQRLLPHLTLLTGKGRRRSDSKAGMRGAPDGIDSRGHQEQMAELAGQVDNLEAARSQALREVEARNEEIRALRDELDSRRKETGSLSESVAGHAGVIARQELVLAERARLLVQSESDVKRLTSELSQVLRSRELVQERLDKAEQRSAEATALQGAVVQLRARVAQQAGELESLRRELASRHAAYSELEKRLESQSPADHDAVISEQNRALSDTTAALEATQIRVRHLATELDSAQRARDAALAALEEVKGNVALLNRSLHESNRARDELRGTADALAGSIDQLRQEVAARVAELEAERAARLAADQAGKDAMAAAQQLREQEKALRVTASRLEAELKSSRERAFSAYALERYVADLQKALEERTSELNARAQTVTDLEGQVRNLRNESESIRIRTLIERSGKTATNRTPAPRPAATKPPVAKRAYSSQAVALYEHSLSQIPAYQLLKHQDPGFYDGWMKEYQLLVGQGLTDKQVNDALRANQSRWMERHLLRAADKTVIAYVRLLVEQLDEFLLEGAEPCLSFLVPQPRPARGVAPDYPEHMAERELDLLHLVLTTHDARKSRPKESDVWPDLEPIFAELFDRFGAENVAAIENSFDPSRDRSELCNVSKTLFTRILALPEAKAAAALRWMIASK